MNPFAWLEKQFDSVMNEMREHAFQSSSKVLKAIATFYHSAYYGLKVIYQLSKIAAMIIAIMTLMNISQTLQRQLDFNIFVFEQAQAGIKGA